MFQGDPVIIAVDVANIGYRAAFAPHYADMRTTNGIPSGHIFGTTQILLSCIKKIAKGRPFEFWFAVEGYPRWRYELLPSYKSNRVREGDALDPLPEVVDLVKCFPGKVWHHSRLEADDVLSRLVRHKKPSQPMAIVSADHDLWQLSTRRGVEVWSGRGKENKPIGQQDVMAKFGVLNAQSIPLIKALFGDSSDVIKPCAPRLPRKPLKDFINDRSLTTAEEFLETLDNLENSDPGLWKNTRAQTIVAHQETLRLNYKIVKLRIKSKIQPKPIEGPDNLKPLTQFLKSYECHSLVKRLGELWIK